MPHKGFFTQSAIVLLDGKNIDSKNSRTKRR